MCGKKICLIIVSFLVAAAGVYLTELHVIKKSSCSGENIGVCFVN